ANMYGHAVAFVNGKVVFGDPLTQNANIPEVIGRPQMGGFYTFQRTGDVWNLTHNNVTPGFDRGRDSQDFFGISVMVGGDDWVAIGAPGHGYTELGATITNYGAAFVFAKNPLTDKWSYEKKLTTNTTLTTNYNQLGYGLTMRDGKMIVSNTGNRHAIFQREGTTWTQTGDLGIADISIYIGQSAVISE